MGKVAKKPTTAERLEDLERSVTNQRDKLHYMDKQWDVRLGWLRSRVRDLECFQDTVKTITKVGVFVIIASSLVWSLVWLHI